MCGAGSSRIAATARATSTDETGEVLPAPIGSAGSSASHTLAAARYGRLRPPRGRAATAYSDSRATAPDNGKCPGCRRQPERHHTIRFYTTNLRIGPEVAHWAPAMSYNRCSRSENQVVRRLAGTASE